MSFEVENFQDAKMRLFFIVTPTLAASLSSFSLLQHHDMIVTSADVGLALHCKYELNNQTVTNSLLSGLEVKSAIETADFFEETIVESPNVIMRVTNPKGEDVLTAQVWSFTGVE